ncbi:MAG: hypothetical protein ACQEQF_12805 [Bacillota bacterium]
MRMKIEAQMKLRKNENPQNKPTVSVKENTRYIKNNDNKIKSNSTFQLTA